MADEELDLDTKGGGKLTKILILLVIVLVLALGGLGAWMFMGKGGEAAEGEGETAKAEEHAPAAAVQPAHYLPLKPEFTVNFADDRKAAYLQVEITVMARKPEALSVVETEMPVIRNDVLNLLSSKTYDELSDRAGKEKLADEILKTIQGIVQAQLHEPGVEAVYFTSFVMQ